MMNQGAKQSVNSRRTYSVYVLFVILAFFYCYALVQIFIKDQVHIWEQDGVVIFVIIGLLILYCIALFAILKVAIHNKSKDEIIHPFKPVTNQPLSGEGNCLFAVLQEIDLLLKDNATVNEKISKLVIPVPKNLSNENMTPFVDYIIDLSELPYSISKLTDEPINQSETITSPIASRAAESLVRFGYVTIENIQTLTEVKNDRRIIKLIITLKKTKDFQKIFDENKEEMKKREQEREQEAKAKEK